MKTTLDIPDDLYRQVKAKSALLGKPVREVTIDLYRRWLHERAAMPQADAAQAWLSGWLAEADATMSAATPGPCARELLQGDRDRLERR